ncbi:uncharacterized protein VDAG_07067 [Verticillium dahliae VdLs.17]|uniref:Uncharacterized protein n=1 Tax=Verticillium dahliae (strain VdLs.17 / ATCC MYA-4575 / FGSC 10137) TaxID=498257 RepID=G2XAG4_VERDV|nr:uncharacterized protein VDAG_07067 [Verticillium dahliae VdLs.17]EGY15903.1 hypothetical protein VDAG_07067 [Verticillium dahliae VdLs.17]KAH6677983.1 hypothetical protein EV126DRAFT_164333 [Verticillium dahliae]KAH6702204.1 hypothetical protein EV126DRAFT_221967 [Verticillium dahliae]
MTRSSRGREGSEKWRSGGTQSEKRGRTALISKAWKRCSSKGEASGSRDGRAQSNTHNLVPDEDSHRLERRPPSCESNRSRLSQGSQVSDNDAASEMLKNMGDSVREMLEIFGPHKKKLKVWSKTPTTGSAGVCVEIAAQVQSLIETDKVCMETDEEALRDLKTIQLDLRLRLSEVRGEHGRRDFDAAIEPRLRTIHAELVKWPNRLSTVPEKTAGCVRRR